MLSEPFRSKALFASEAELCSAFIKQMPKTWTAYPETAGFDILLVRNADGVQVGVEAKLTLNTKVIDQIMEPGLHSTQGPDFRAVLIPWGTTGGLLRICDYLGITVIEMRDREMYLHERAPYAGMSYVNTSAKKFKPDLPVERSIYWGFRQEWHDLAPVSRMPVPAYVPDVAAGSKAPTQLSEWKIKAIKLWIILEKRGYVTKADFNHLKLDHRRWMSSSAGWLKAGETRGHYVAGNIEIGLRAQHPRNFLEIEADYDKWAPKEEKLI